jgi:hypothetical protein
LILWSNMVDEWNPCFKRDFVSKNI